MTVAIGGPKRSYPAADDYSSIGQFRLVTINSDGDGKVATAGDRIVGIGQNKPGAADRGYAVQYAGVSKLLMNSTCNEGDMIASGTHGGGTVASTNNEEYGAMALEASGGSGVYIAVQVLPGQIFGT